jgi:tetraacyldisaccharide 4'-kinase
VAAGEPGVAAGMARAALAAASVPYGAAVRLRNWRLDRRKATCPLPAISVGNLTVGGTGKTPVVRWLAGQLLEANRRPAILTRGYHGGDEAAELRTLLGEAVPVIIASDRLVGAATAKAGGADCVVLDDGFQHRRCGRVFDLVLIDATTPLGHGRLLPRGLLREPMSGLRRADAVLLTRCHAVGEDVRRALRQLLAGQLVFEATTRLGELPTEPRRYAAFCGLGNPAAFFTDLRRRLPASACVGTVAYADHHRYTAADVGHLRQRFADVDALLTTGKDFVKVKDLAAGEVPIVPMPLAVEVGDGGGGFCDARTACWSHPRSTLVAWLRRSFASG